MRKSISCVKAPRAIYFLCSDVPTVFVIGESETANVNQMIEAVLRDGYCIAQEYLPAATEGDVRLFVMNGRPLEKDGKYAAFRRVNKTGDARSNMHSGGQAEPVDTTDEMLSIVEIATL